VFFNWCEGTTLYVCSLDQRSGSADVQVLEIPDILSAKKWRKVLRKPKYGAEFTFHIVVDHDTGNVEVHISERHSAAHMSLEVDTDGSYEMKAQRSFIEHMMGQAAAPKFSISKRSEEGLD
jgi:hypothetical protein